MDINFYESEALLSMPFVLIVVYKRGGTDSNVSPTQKKSCWFLGLILNTNLRGKWKDYVCKSFVLGEDVLQYTSRNHGLNNLHVNN
jgi:hypothetical protein